MSSTTLHAGPRTSDVLREQIRTVLGATRPETIGAGILLLFVAAMYTLDAAIGGPEPFGFNWSERLGPVAILGFFAAVAVWRGEDASRRSYMWSMPITHSRHTLLKVFSGWLWLMGVLAVILLCGFAASWITGGEMGAGETQLALYDVATRTVPSPYEIVEYRWLPLPGWMVLVPFVGVTIAYLLGSIPVVLSAHPWRTFALAFVVVLFGGAILELFRIPGATEWVFHGPFNPELAFTGRQAHEADAVMEGTLYRVRIYQPDLAAWTKAALGWLTVALAGVVGAAFRHQER